MNLVRGIYAVVFVTLLFKAQANHSDCALNSNASFVQNEDTLASNVDFLPYNEDEEGDALFVDTSDSILILGGGIDFDKLSPLVRKILEDSSYWRSVAPWFATFDSLNVNPYSIDGAKYKDTVSLVLYDTLADENARLWNMPLVKSEITSNFGQRRYRWHYGIDLRLSTGDSVLVAFDGVVRISKYNAGGYGHYVLVRHHNGLETLYGHLSKRLVSVGQEVRAGELLGWGGSTGRSSGPHLHYEVRYQGNAIDPTTLYDFQKHTIKHRIWELTPSHFKYIRDAKKSVLHTVKRGDTLGAIAVRYGTTVTNICKLNNISRNKTLQIGQKLRVR